MFQFKMCPVKRTVNFIQRKTAPMLLHRFRFSTMPKNIFLPKRAVFRCPPIAFSEVKGLSLRITARSCIYTYGIRRSSGYLRSEFNSR